MPRERLVEAVGAETDTDVLFRSLRDAAALGAEFRRLLEGLVAGWPALFERVSGRGLLLGLHCARAEVAGLFIRACQARQTLVTPCLTSPHVVRLTPPVCVGPAELEFAASALAAAAEQTFADLRD